MSKHVETRYLLGLPQSTISSWYRKGMVPTVASLEKICQAFGITLSQLFAEDEEAVTLTGSQRLLLQRWSKLSKEQQKAIFNLIDLMQHTDIPNKLMPYFDDYAV